ncbi:MAG TPA: MoxR family ATPase [Fimbriimonadaceae bacterium]|nr:MoxR family ATPase [Fimbriimonadaceae bacterium]
MTIKEISEKSLALVDEIERVIVGKREIVEKAVLCLLCNGHLLIEDIPGVGKTTLAKALARSIGGAFGRVQFTPDLLPADITGSSIFNQKTAEFEFRPGPIFANVVLVDEINRATPKTQSALLEAMEERQVTTDGESRDLPVPFFVLATQNSIEMTGTYPLPEAQLDRFFMRISLGYPDKVSETAILARQQVSHPLELVKAVISISDLLELQTAVRDVFVHETVREYIVEVVRATRSNNQLLMGSSPRGSLYLMRAAQAHAAMEGSEFVRPDDVKAVAASVLSHRVLPRSEVRAKGGTTEQAIERLLTNVPVPVPVS